MLTIAVLLAQVTAVLLGAAMASAFVAGAGVRL